MSSPSLRPTARYVCVTRLTRPFSHLVPFDDFPKQIDVWTREGREVRAIADVPMGDTVPITGVITGPRTCSGIRTRPARWSGPRRSTAAI